MDSNKINIAVFASGNGTNAQAIMEYFDQSNLVKIKTVYTNNSSAYALVRAKKFGVGAYSFTKHEFYFSGSVLKHLLDNEINLIVLAGFMWLVPEMLIDKFTIINIHPALLPKYGGKGMYGHYVHERVLENKENRSGITIHYVNKEYDKGDILLQESCEVLPNDTPEVLAGRIHQLEHKFYPKVIEELSQKLISKRNLNA